MNTAVDDWFDALNDAQGVVLTDLRRIILDADKRIVEEIKWGQPCYSLGGLFCYLAKAKQHVNLGFQMGAHLPDPHGLLQGSGKNMRHMKVFLDDAPDRSKTTKLVAGAVSYVLKQNE